MMKQIEIKIPFAYLSAGIGQKIQINNFSINKRINEATKASVTIIPENEDMNLSFSTYYNILLENDSIFAGYIERISRVFDSINIDLFGKLETLDFFPIINDNSEDGCYKYLKGTSVSSVVSDLCSKAGFTQIPVHTNINDPIPDDMSFGNGQSLLSCIKELVDLAGGILIEKLEEIIAVLPSEYNSGGISVGDELINYTVVGTNQYLYSQVFVRDYEMNLKKPVKVYQYIPYPYNKRAIYYTFRGKLDKNQALTIANKILTNLNFNQTQYSIEFAGFKNIELLDTVSFQNGTFKATEISYRYTFQGNPELVTVVSGVGM